MASQDSVYLYRNGIADFRRFFSVGGKEGTKVSLPVKEAQVGDVLASLDYFGPVKLTKPPGYTPKDTTSSLTIDASDPLGSALKAFSGARVALIMKSGTLAGNKVEGTLAGIEVVEESSPTYGTIVPKKYVGIYTSEGLQYFNLRDDIRAVQFVSDADKAEFDKALARNYQRIKPGSTFIDLILTSSTGQDVQAILQYALPCAAWNMSYRLKRDKQGSWSLAGHAVVHNTTDFDWLGYSVSVVTGEPITFDHDLAEAKVPSRSRVNVTADSAQGAVRVESGRRMSPIHTYAAGANVGGGKGLAAAPTSMSFGALGPMASPGYGEVGLESTLSAADMDMAEVQTVGDFLILTSPNAADIPANQSALVPMFNHPIDDAERVFYYKPQNNPGHPYSAVKFRNTTGMPLVKGVVTVSIEDHNAGEAVLEDAKPGDVRLVAHSLESGIRITPDTPKKDEPYSQIRINEGNIYTERRALSSQEYTIKNKLAEEASILIEHAWNVPQSDVQAMVGDEPIVEFEKISTGVRFTVKVPAQTTVTCLVKENKLLTETVVLDGGRFDWVAQQGWFDQDDQFKGIASIQEEINRLQRERNELDGKRSLLQKDQQRYNNFLPNTTGQNRDRWEAAIGKAEDEIVIINEKKLPDKDREIQAAHARMHEALKKLRASWTPRQAKQAVA